VDDLEIILIEQYRAYIRDEDSNGYNQTRGGKGWSSDVVKEMAKTRSTANYSVAASGRVKKLVDEGRHNWLGERGSENATKRNLNLAARGEHPAQRVKICPHCQVEGRGPNLYRYHFNKCAMRA
jgi:hypothetical protein